MGAYPGGDGGDESSNNFRKKKDVVPRNINDFEINNVGLTENMLLSGLNLLLIIVTADPFTYFGVITDVPSRK